MLIHIVRTNESINAIMDAYKVSLEDIVSNNKHITDFYHLKSGTKIFIPLLKKEVIQTLEGTEPFISDYYPTIEKHYQNNSDISSDASQDLGNEEAEPTIKESIPSIEENSITASTLIESEKTSKAIKNKNENKNEAPISEKKVLATNNREEEKDNYIITYDIYGNPRKVKIRKI